MAQNTFANDPRKKLVVSLCDKILKDDGLYIYTSPKPFAQLIKDILTTHPNSKKAVADMLKAKEFLES